jgi:hypothetical protein
MSDVEQGIVTPHHAVERCLICDTFCVCVSIFGSCVILLLLGSVPLYVYPLRRPRLAFPPPTQSTHRHIPLLPRRHHHPAFSGTPEGTSSSKRHRMPMVRIRLRASPLARLFVEDVVVVCTVLSLVLYTKDDAVVMVVLPWRFPIVALWLSGGMPLSLSPTTSALCRHIHIAPRTHTWRNPRRVRRRIVYRKRAFFKLQ